MEFQNTIFFIAFISTEGVLLSFSGIIIYLQVISKTKMVFEIRHLLTAVFSVGAGSEPALTKDLTIFEMTLDG
ncbi:MAG: hypothetical protein HGB19_05395 [Chlorobiales bacterium]|nr:hypothetical protein [Chlorobiales bacterium]